MRDEIRVLNYLFVINGANDRRVEKLTQLDTFVRAPLTPRTSSRLP